MTRMTMAAASLALVAGVAAPAVAQDAGRSSYGTEGPARADSATPAPEPGASASYGTGTASRATPAEPGARVGDDTTAPVTCANGRRAAPGSC